MEEFILIAIMTGVAGFVAGALIKADWREFTIEDEEIDQEIKYLEGLKKRNAARRRRKRRGNDGQG